MKSKTESFEGAEGKGARSSNEMRASIGARRGNLRRRSATAVAFVLLTIPGCGDDATVTTSDLEPADAAASDGSGELDVDGGTRSRDVVSTEDSAASGGGGTNTVDAAAGTGNPGATSTAPADAGTSSDVTFEPSTSGSSSGSQATAIEQSSLDTTSAVDAGDTSGTMTVPVVEEADVIATAQSLMQEAHFPGMALATFDANGVTWSMGLGYAESGAERPITADTSFWLASVTKPFTGLAILRAIEQAELSLDTEIGGLLDESGAFTLADAEAGQATLAQLVTHHSPIRDSSAYLCGYYMGTEAEHTSLANLFELGAGCDDAQPVDLGGFLESYLSAGGAYYRSDNFGAADQGFVYSNVGAALAGYAVELATGTPLATYAREQLFEPLGLANTSFEYSDLDPQIVATPTRWDSEQQAIVDYPLYELATWPDGGLRSSVADLGKLCAALLNDGSFGETQILSPQSVTTAFTPLAEADSGEVAVFWMIGDDTSYSADGSSRRLAGHNGGDPGAATMIVLDLDNDFGIVVLANGELSDQAAADRTNDLARVLYRFAEQRAAAD